MKIERLIKYVALISAMGIMTGCGNANVTDSDYIPPIVNKVDVDMVEVNANDDCFDNQQLSQGKERLDEQRYSEYTELLIGTENVEQIGGSNDIENINRTEEESGDVEDKLSPDDVNFEPDARAYTFVLSKVPEYSGMPYVVLNDNQPTFSKGDLSTDIFEEYSELDELGRCGIAYANICKEIMPTEERGPIGAVKPSGWHTVKYNDLIDGNYLYNRCHLIGYQLAGENANVNNLITGTRYLNVQGMLLFENMVADYVVETSNHVLYKVTPVFDGNNLVASGVIIEALSVEDNGEGICFNVYVYNVQPGIVIDYKTGSSERDLNYTGTGTKIVDSNNEKFSLGEVSAADSQDIISLQAEGNYVLNTNTHKFHTITCSSVSDMSEKNKKVSMDSREQIIMDGYTPCKKCNP